MFADFFPTACSRLRIFISYSTAQRAVAHEMAQALKNAGHRVFFDQESLTASVDYNTRIRRAIESSDRFVFLASRDSLTPGRFTLTELAFAQERWPSAEGCVLPVIVDPQLKPMDLPVYLRSVHALTVAGNATAEVAAAVAKTRHVGWFCKSVTMLAGAAAAAFAVAFYMGVGLLQPPTDVAMLPIKKVQFRSTDQPPRGPATPNTPPWFNSRVTVTAMPVGYQHRTDPGRRARVLNETITLNFGGTIVPYKALYFVEITDAACGERWYCIKGNAGPETLEPGKTISRETLFYSEAAYTPTWKEFVDSILGHDGFRISLVMNSTIEAPDRHGTDPKTLAVNCTIDVKALRSEMEALGYKTTVANKPDYLQADCN